MLMAAVSKQCHYGQFLWAAKKSGPGTARTRPLIWGLNNYKYHFGGSLLEYLIPQNPILIIEAPIYRTLLL